MPLLVRAEARGTSARGLAVWRVVTWLLLLFAAIGGVQNMHHANAVWRVLQRWSVDDTAHVSALHRMLAWDVAFLVAALVVIVVCAGAILRQSWARGALRLVSLILALWALVSGTSLFLQMRALFPPGAGLSQTMSLLPHSYPLALALKAVAIPLLLWLAWRLGRPAVRAQFGRRR